MRGHMCAKPATIERDGKWWCKAHDPEHVKAKRASWHAKYQAEPASDEAIKARAQELAQALGLDGRADTDARGWHYVERLVISFADAERLIARLRGGG